LNSEQPELTPVAADHRARRPLLLKRGAESFRCPIEHQPAVLKQQRAAAKHEGVHPHRIERRLFKLRRLPTGQGATAPALATTNVSPAPSQPLASSARLHCL